MRRQDSGSSCAGVGKLRHGRTWKRELRRLCTRSIVIKRTFPRGVSSWALSHTAVVTRLTAKPGAERLLGSTPIPYLSILGTKAHGDRPGGGEGGAYAISVGLCPNYRRSTSGGVVRCWLLRGARAGAYL
eukprot:4898747-Prymnesium_polylepis.1